MKNALNEADLQQWHDQGFLVLRSAMGPRMVSDLSGAIDRIIEKAQRGEYGGNFQWVNEDQGVPAFISDLLGAEKYDDAFGTFLAEVAIPTVEELLKSPVRCSWMMMLRAGGEQPYSIALHRDNSAVGNSALEEEWLAKLRGQSCYFQAALLPDSFLYVVPGSHLRLANNLEVAASGMDGDLFSVPGLVQIKLEPGDVVYRHTNTLHSGSNLNGDPRRTFVAGMWAESLELLDIELQDYPLLNNPAWVERLPSRLQSAVKRYLKAYADRS